MRGLDLVGPQRLIWAPVLVAAFILVGIGLAVGQSNEVTVVLPGGTLAKAFRKNVVEPFEQQHRARVNVVTGLTMENLAKLRAQKDNPQIDVVI